MADPLGVSVAFDAATLAASPTWTRLDTIAGLHLRGWTIQRGRSTELDRMETGTATVTFVDEDGILDPTNTSSPFWDGTAGATKIDPTKQAAIALYDPVGVTWRTLFRGFVTEWLYDVDVTGTFTTVTLEMADAFEIFSALELTPGVHGDTPPAADFPDVYYAGTPSNFPDEAPVFVHVDSRITKLLTDADWAGTLQDVFTGNVSVQGTVVERRGQLLAALQDAFDAEFPGVAVGFVSRDGIVTFHGRFARFFPGRPEYNILTWKVGDGAAAALDSTVAPLAGNLSFRRSRNDIINSALVLPQGADDTDVAAALVEDATSIATHGYRTFSAENLIVSAGHTTPTTTPTTAAEETRRMGAFYVNNMKDPRTRVQTMRFRPRALDDPNAAALWALMSGVELGDLVPLKTTHPGGGGFDEDFFVEGIRYEAVPMGPDFPDVTLELDVSPRSFWTDNPFGDEEALS